MNIKSIGTIIANLRKEKGVTQEELAKYTLVSTQAVSKWENGGVPDTELLPKIADFFGVSIDTLFGRSITDYSDIENALANKIMDTQEDDRFNLAFELCWLIERALFSNDGELINKNKSVKDYQDGLGDKGLHYSSIRRNDGFTLMGLSRRLPYFLLAPEATDKNLAFFEGIDYINFFKDFSDKIVFDAMVFFNKRESEKGFSKDFTTNLLMQNLKIEAEKAAEVIKILQKYGVIHVKVIEVDDIKQEIYKFAPTPSFIALLIFAREMINRPNVWDCFIENRSKPYLT